MTFIFVCQNDEKHLWRFIHTIIASFFSSAVRASSRVCLMIGESILKIQNHIFEDENSNEIQIWPQ